MKKSRKRIILYSIFLVVIILFIIFSKNNYFRNSMQVNGKGIVQVAKWSFLVNGETESINPINLMQNYNSNTLATNNIAPGTKGSFDIIIDATDSKVGINYSVVFENETIKPQNLLYTYDKHTVNNLKELEQFLTGTINQNDNEKIKKITIIWEWPYETKDDTNEGKFKDKEDTKDAQELEKYQFDVIVTGKQVEPEQ